MLTVTCRPPKTPNPSSSSATAPTAKSSGASSIAGAEWELLQVNDFEEPIYATPAITVGRLYVRTASALLPSARREGGTVVSMKLTIELDREVDGRWIAEVPELNVLLYGDSEQDAIQRAQLAAKEILLDRIAHAELPPDSANATFEIAA